MAVSEKSGESPLSDPDNESFPSFAAVGYRDASVGHRDTANSMFPKSVRSVCEPFFYSEGIFSRIRNTLVMSTQPTEDRILSVLEEDAQASYAEIADRANVSKPTVRKYIEKLEDEGVIVGYSAEIDPKKLSSKSIALVGMDVASEKYVEATRDLKALDEVETLYSSSGDHMLMAEVRAADGDAVGDVISEKMLDIDGVTAAHPSFLQERLK